VSDISSMKKISLVRSGGNLEKLRKWFKEGKFREQVQPKDFLTREVSVDTTSILNLKKRVCKFLKVLYVTCSVIVSTDFAVFKSLQTGRYNLLSP
jgi:hypothetical protein